MSEQFSDWRARLEQEEAAAKANGQAATEIEIEAWWRDPATIPPREVLYGRHYSRKNIGASIGAGGRLKTSHSLFEAIEMALARNLTTGSCSPVETLRVLALNAEEDQDELDRRVAAICQRYNVSEADLGGRLFVKSVRDQPLRLATLAHNVPTLNQAALGQLASIIEHNKIDVFMLDPFISFHAVSENDNLAMDLIIKQGLGGIATRTNSAGEIFHHPGKPKTGQAETTVEDGRGASAILWAVRSARVFNFMTPDEATKLGITEDDRRRHIKVTNGKANMGPIGLAEWLKIEVENLPNGDQVACSTRYTMPNPFEGVTTAHLEVVRKVAQGGAFRADSQSPDWFGFAIADSLNIPVAYGADNHPKDLARLKSIIKTWCKNKVLKVQRRKDEARRERDFIVPGPAGPKPQPVTSTTPEDDEISLH